MEVDTRVGARANRQDLAAAFALCESSAGTVYRFARMVARSEAEAEDIAHDSLLRVIRSAHRFDEAKGDVGGWLWTIVVNTARDHGRVSSRAGGMVARLIASQRTEATPDPSDLAVGRIEDDTLIQAIRALPKRSRSLIALRYGADLPFYAVARQLGMSAGGARMAHRRALVELRRLLMKE